MAKYARGKKSQAISDVGGLRVPYTQLKTTWDGLRVSPEDFDPKQPQLTPAKNVVDATALLNGRPDTDPENVVVFIGYTQDWTIDSRLRTNRVGVSANANVGRCQFEIFNTSQTGVGGTANVGTAEATIQTEIIAVGQSGDGEVGTALSVVVVTGVSGSAGAGNVGAEALDISLEPNGLAGDGDVGDISQFLEVNPSGAAGTADVGDEEFIVEETGTGIGGTGNIGVAIVEDPFGWGEGGWGQGPYGDTAGRPHPIGQSGSGGVGTVTITADMFMTPSGVGGSASVGTENFELLANGISGIGSTGAIGSSALEADLTETGVGGTGGTGSFGLSVNEGWSDGTWSDGAWGE